MSDTRATLENKGLVSIVMPVYNVEAWLAQALDSLSAQTYPHWECICVDDGSKDRSPDIVQAFAEKDPRFRLLMQENQGPGAARNNALQHVRGEFLIFVDSDDLVAPDLLETCVRRLTEDDSDVCVYGHIEFGGEKPDASCQAVFDHMPVQEDGGCTVITPQEAKGELFRYVGAYACTRMCRKRLIEDGGLDFPTHIRYSEDDYIVLLAMALARRITFVRRALYFYRKFREGNLSSSLKSERICLDFVEASRTTWRGLRERGLLNPYGVDELLHSLSCAPFYFFCIPTMSFLNQAYGEMRQMYVEKRAELVQLGMTLDESTLLKLQAAYANLCKKARMAKVRLLLRKVGLAGLTDSLYRGLKKLLKRG